MERISSGTTFVYKRVAPVLTLGSVVGTAAYLLFGRGMFADTGVVLLLLVLPLVACSHWIFHWGLADEVDLSSDSLQIRIGREVVQVPAWEIHYVHAIRNFSPRVRLVFPVRWAA